MRKASDLSSLLASRGRGRGRGRAGWLGSFASAFGSVLGRRTDPLAKQPAKKATNLVAIAIGFVCLGVGYLLGDRFPLSHAAGSGLQAGGREARPRDPQVPHTVGETPATPGNPANPGNPAKPTAADLQPLTSTALFVSMYEGTDEGAATALKVARHLQSQGIADARPYLLWRGDGSSIWTTVVYYDGEAARAAATQKLQQVSAPADDPMFDSFRHGSEWPVARRIERRGS